MKIGILAIQGSVIEHRRALEKLGVEVREVRLPTDLSDISGIILPGGESTAQSKLLKSYKLFDPLKKKLQAGLPAWGTCTGAILLAKQVTGKNAPTSLAVMDIIADRNWYGAQRESFIAKIEVHLPDPGKNGSRPGSTKTEAIFIRAPRLEKIAGTEVQVLATYKDMPVVLQQRNLLATAFHPELTDDLRIHRYFLEMCQVS